MDTTLQQQIERDAQDAHAGRMSFGELVGALIKAGVESYHADYRSGRTTYYLPDGAAFSVPLSTPDLPIATAFDPLALEAAIRGSQRGEVEYPEFLQRSMTAGCVSYQVWIAGRKVTYFGRRGEEHVEPFPQ